MKIYIRSLLAAAFLTAGCSDPAGTESVLSRMTFAEVPPGSFLMGSPPGEEGRYADEGPIHTVTIDYPFEILTTEVTQAMWEDVMGSNPSAFISGNNPVESVSWDDCQEFIQQMNLLDPLHNYRLPSEAEWEYACRAGTQTSYYNGNTENDLNSIGWYSKNSGSTTESVGQKQPNAWGLYDMSGNVWEWCEDYYHEDYSGAPDDGSPWLNSGGETRSARGGSIGSAARRCRSAARDECYQGLRYYFLGFRIVRTPL